MQTVEEWAKAGEMSGVEHGRLSSWRATEQRIKEEEVNEEVGRKQGGNNETTRARMTAT